MADLAHQGGCCAAPRLVRTALELLKLRTQAVASLSRKSTDTRVRVPKTTSGSVTLGRHHSLPVVILTAVVYSSENVQSTVNKGRGARVKSRRDRAPVSRVFSQEESHKMLLIPQQRIVTTCVKCYVPGEPIRDSAPRVFIGARSPRHPLPSTGQNS